MFRHALFLAVWENCRIWLYLIVTFIVISLGMFVYQTQFVSAEKMNLLSRQDELEKLYEAREAKLAETGVPASAVEKIDKNLEEFSALIPGKEKFSEFLGDLFSWAQQSGLNIRQISYQPKLDNETGFLNYGLSFTVNGSYSNIKRFINLLENSRRIIIIERIGLTGKQNKDNSSTVSLQVNLKTFFRETAE